MRLFFCLLIFSIIPSISFADDQDFKHCHILQNGVYIALPEGQKDPTDTTGNDENGSYSYCRCLGDCRIEIVDKRADKPQSASADSANAAWAMCILAICLLFAVQSASEHGQTGAATGLISILSGILGIVLQKVLSFL